VDDNPQPSPPRPTSSAANLAAAYALVAACYIIASTLLAGRLTVGTEAMVYLEVLKGLGFVAVTALLLFLGTRYLLARMERQSAEICRQRTSLLVLDRRATAGLMASAIAHDANNLLASIQLSVEMLGRSPDPQKREQICQRLLTMIGELTHLNDRLVAGGEAEQPGKMEIRDLRDEIDWVLHFIDANHAIKRLNLSIEHQGDVRVPVNRHLFFQAVFNLLKNAARHAGEGAFVRVRAESAEDKVRLEFHDDGPGVPGDKRDQVFEPFYTIHVSGAGLGLASVRAIMRLHGGDIHCEASDLGGACFVLHFPRNEEQRREAASA